jgi:succinoglycan biosynthesis protein ExoA
VNDEAGPAGENVPSPERVDVSVLIPVLDEERHILETVRAMQAQRFDGEIEFLFTDGGSRDRTREILEELALEDPRIRVLDNPGRRTPHGLNVGLRNARGRYVARMDGHAVYPRDYLALGVARLERNGVDWVSGPQVPRGSGRWSRRVALALTSGIATIGSRKWAADGADPSGPERELDTGVWVGVWRRETLERHGGWDEGWPVNQDSELAARVLATGGRIVLLPAMAGYYVPRDSLRGLWLQYWRYGFYRAKTARRHPHSARRSHLLAPGLVVTVAVGVGGGGALARLARFGIAAYAVALTAASVRSAWGGEAGHAASPRDAASLPLVAATMHLSFGCGWLWHSLRYGPPFEALRHMARAGAPPQP